MDRFITVVVITIFFGVFIPFSGKSQNPIIQTIYSADPAPLVYKDTVYLYTGHDEDKSTWFTMKDWHVYSTVDMVNWTDIGSPLSLETFSWASKDAWAGQCIFRNNKFYFYVPINQKNGKGMAIGVAVSDSPTGPFKDALGKPLVHSGAGDIDPTVYIDDDNQAYLYWGNPYLKFVKLNENMISFIGEINTVPLTQEGFSVRNGDPKRSSQYEEGPWLYKRNSLYYLLYPAGGVPEHIAYSTSKSITGPWIYRDTIMPVIRKDGAFTNHPAIIDYKGKSYFFYHNGALPGGGGFNRSVCVDEFNYNADGTIPEIKPTTESVKPAQNLNPFKRTEAETIAWTQGVETAKSIDKGIYVTEISNNDYIKLRSVDFRKRAKQFQANLVSIKDNSQIEIRLDSLTGPILTSIPVKSTGDLKKWTTQTYKIDNKVKGIHDLYFVFKGEGDDLLNLDWWQFN